MKNMNLDDLSDDELYASFEAYKALLDAGLTKEQALSRTGLTAQIVKDFEEEEKAMEEDDDFRDDFKEVWDDDEDLDDESKWKEENLDDEWEQFDDDDAGGADWDDRY
ncbi:MAG: hypothetical protein ACK40G_05080 [Cytophagaceae bacterium]